MKKYIALLLFGWVCMIACSNIEKNESKADATESVQYMDMCKEDLSKRPTYEISFFGEMIVLDDSAHVAQQIMNIVEKNEMLAIDGQILTVCDVDFGLNIRAHGIDLLSSTKVDDDKIKQVVKYLDCIYDKAREDEPDNFWWCAEGSNNMVCEKTIRLRPLHSDEGGTVIFFY